MSPVDVSFKLRKFKCEIAEKKKMKVKLTAQMNIKYNKNFDCFEGSTGSLKDISHLPKFERHLPHENQITISLCDENHLIVRGAFEFA